MKGAPVTNTQPIYRAAMDLTVEGRTLLGLAAPYDVPALVSDWGGPRYWESLAPSVFVRSLEQQPWPRPLYMHHEWAANPTTEPLGVTDFVQSQTESALLFRAHVGKSRKGDMVLDRYKSGRPTGVSVGAMPVEGGTVTRTMDGREVLVRTEAKLLELSISRSGIGQYANAKVLALRAAPDGASFGDIGEAVEDALTADLFPSAPEDGPADAWVCIQDLSDNWVVYSIGGNVSEDAGGLWRRDYDMADDGAVTLQDAVPVELSYTPIARADTALVTGTPDWLLRSQEYRRLRRF